MPRTVQNMLYTLASKISPTAKTGQRIQEASAALTIDDIANTTPIAVTTVEDHQLQTGHRVFISGAAVSAVNNTAGNPSWVIAKTGAKTFTLNDSTAAGASAVNQGTVVGALIGTVDMQDFTAAELLTFYNEARMQLYSAYKAVRSFSDRIAAFTRNVKAEQITWTYNGTSQSVAAFPVGYVDLISMTTVNNVIMRKLPVDMMQRVEEGFLPEFKQDASKIFIFETTDGFIHFSVGLVPTASTYRARYIKITPYALFTDVTGNSTVDDMDDELHPFVLELAQLISTEMGALEVAAAARQLIGGK